MKYLVWGRYRIGQKEDGGLAWYQMATDAFGTDYYAPTLAAYEELVQEMIGDPFFKVIVGEEK